MAIPTTDPWYRAETVPPNLAAFAYALAAAYGAPRSAVGIRGNPETHFRGAHRSRAFIRNSPHCTNRTYTVSRTPGDRSGGDSNWVVGVDLTLPAAKLIQLCRRLDAALRSGRHEEVTEWYGNDDGDNRVDGFDNIANVVASSDPSHLWHLHMTFDRGKANNDHSVLLAELTGGDDMFTDADRDKLDRIAQLAELAGYGGANAARRADTGIQEALAELRAFVAEERADDDHADERVGQVLAGLAEIAAGVAAIPGADPEELAERIGTVLGPNLTRELLDGLYARLEA